MSVSNTAFPDRPDSILILFSLYEADFTVMVASCGASCPRAYCAVPPLPISDGSRSAGRRSSGSPASPSKAGPWTLLRAASVMTNGRNRSETRVSAVSGLKKTKNNPHRPENIHPIHPSIRDPCGKCRRLTGCFGGNGGFRSFVFCPIILPRFDACISIPSCAF